MSAKLERWLDRYFLEQETAKIERTTNPGIRSALYTADIAGVPVVPWFDDETEVEEECD